MRYWLLVAVLALVPVNADARPQTLQFPFETWHGIIFIHATVNKHDALLLLDTGSNVSLIFDSGFGLECHGEGFRTNDEFHNIGMKDNDLIKHAQGIVGEDILKKFSSMRVDYKNHIVELER